MANVWEAARRGDVGEVERFVGQDPGLLDAWDFLGRTPLIWASERGHVRVVRLLLDKGAAINNASRGSRFTALWWPPRRGAAAAREGGRPHRRRGGGLDSLDHRIRLWPPRGRAPAARPSQCRDHHQPPQ
jgi:hypothetical protein